MTRKNKNCEFCKESFVPSHSRTKFCSKICLAQGKKPVSEETKKRLSLSLKEFFKHHKPKSGIEHSKSVGKSTKGKFNKNPKTVLELSSRTISKIFKRLNVGCSLCSWNEASCDIHHINGRKIENAHDHGNLTYVCPNCHRKIHDNKINKDKLVPLSVYIGDRWKEFYYG